MSRLGNVHEEMRAEWARLQECWQTTREQWDDEVAESFERGRWQEWEAQVPEFLRALEDLEDVVARALRETRF